ncbi:Arginine--tRNA ligase [Trichinella pseudospiralis]
MGPGWPRQIERSTSRRSISGQSGSCEHTEPELFTFYSDNSIFSFHRKGQFLSILANLSVGATVKDRLPANAQSSPVDTLFQVAQFCSIDHTGS